MKGLSHITPFGLPLVPFTFDLEELGENIETIARTFLKEEETPLRGIFCLKNSQDMKRMEETEDCFILDFDPFDSFDFKSVTISGDKDLEVIHETGQVASRDYPHPRHLCLNFPFDSTSHESHCDMCYCYICDKPAPCAQWVSSHCNASSSSNSMERKLLTSENVSSYYESNYYNSD